MQGLLEGHNTQGLCHSATGCVLERQGMKEEVWREVG